MIYKEVTAIVFLVGVCTGVLGQVPVPKSNCTKIDSCSCYYDDGTIVSLKPLENTDGTPHFYNVSDSTHDLYSWNPCAPFTYASNNSACVNVSVCMIREGLPFTLFYDIGNQDSADFNVDENGTLKLTYTADKGDFKRVAEITLECQQGSVFDFLKAGGEQEINNGTIVYKLTLASVHACRNAPHINPSQKVKSPSHLSGGTIFLIVLASLIGAYIVFGVMYQGIVKKERGIKLCPNHEFWRSLPENLKAGCKKATFSSEKPTKYDSI